jgi:hypothetical protein
MLSQSLVSYQMFGDLGAQVLSLVLKLQALLAMEAGKQHLDRHASQTVDPGVPKRRGGGMGGGMGGGTAGKGGVCVWGGGGDGACIKSRNGPTAPQSQLAAAACAKRLYFKGIQNQQRGKGLRPMTEDHWRRHRKKTDTGSHDYDYYCNDDDNNNNHYWWYWYNNNNTTTNNSKQQHQ